jgi:hypothetical protein
MHTESWLESLKGRDHSEDLGVGGTIISKWTLGIWGWIGFIWLGIGTGGGLL